MKPIREEREELSNRQGEGGGEGEGRRGEKRGVRQGRGEGKGNRRCEAKKRVDQGRGGQGPGQCRGPRQGRQTDRREGQGGEVGMKGRGEKGGCINGG